MTTPNTKEQLRAGFLAARKIIIGDTLNIVSPELAEPLVRKALSQGKTVRENGITRWIQTNEIVNPGKTGSDYYVWDKSGNKVRARQILVTRYPDGEIVERFMKEIWTQLS